jgi:hypothetical protein
MCKWRHLSMKQGSLFCFVLFLSWDLPSHGASCNTHYIFETLFDVEISQATMLHVVLIVSSKHFWWRLKVHQLGLRLFGIRVWKLLIIEPFSQWKLNLIKIENGELEFEGVVEKALTLIKSDLINFISQFSKLRCGRYLIFKWILLLEVQTNCKNWGVKKEKISWDLKCVHTWTNDTSYTS